MPHRATPHLTMYRYDAVLFDLDGTLLNTLDDLTDALNHTMRRFNHPSHTAEEVRSFVGNGVRKLIQRALPDPDSAETDAAVLEFKRYYTDHCNVRTHPYEGVLEAMTALDEVGVKLAIVSNKNDEAVQSLAHTYFGSLITVSVGGRDGVPRKPAPNMPMAALEALGSEPERTLYVGDSDVDFHTALNAGMDCMLVGWGFRDPEMLEALNAHYFVRDPAEMPALILQASAEES